jgi:hypothetical protein
MDSAGRTLRNIVVGRNNDPKPNTLQARSAWIFHFPILVRRSGESPLACRAHFTNFLIDPGRLIHFVIH